MTETEKNEHQRTEVWTRIITGCVGAVVVGLQGVNLSETNSQTSLIHRIDTALSRQEALISEVNQEGKRIDKALENQQQMIESMETLLHNQQTALDLLKKQ